MFPAAFVICGLLILRASWETVWKLGIAILLGYVILIGNRILGLNSRAPHLEWRSASWLPVYILGMGLISYESTFGGEGNLKLWWDMVVVAVFSLVIYYWALAVGLPAEEIEEMIEEVVITRRRD